MEKLEILRSDNLLFLFHSNEMSISNCSHYGTSWNGSFPDFGPCIIIFVIEKPRSASIWEIERGIAHYQAGEWRRGVSSKYDFQEERRFYKARRGIERIKAQINWFLLRVKTVVTGVYR